MFTHIIKMSLNHLVLNGVQPLLDINVNSITLLSRPKSSVTQNTNINTSVVIDAPCGTINTVSNPNIATGITQSFVVANNYVTTTSQIMLSLAFITGSSSVATGIPVISTGIVTDGGFFINVSNAQATTLNVGLSIDFLVI